MEKDPKEPEKKPEEPPVKSELELKLEKLEKDLENERLASAGKDKKLSQIAKEKAEKELSEKTAEERATALADQVKRLEQKETFRQSFKEVGLNPDDFQEIVNETDPKEQAKKFAELLKDQTAKSAEKALEEFKTKELEKLPKEPNPKGDPETDPFLKGFKKGIN